MKVAPLQEKVVIQSKVTATDSAGGRSVGSWTPHTTVWADIRESTGSEIYESDQTQNPVTHDVVIRNSTDVANITPAMRIQRQDTTKYLYIESIRFSKRLENKIMLRCNLQPFVL